MLTHTHTQDGDFGDPPQGRVKVSNTSHEKLSLFVYRVNFLTYEKNFLKKTVITFRNDFFKISCGERMHNKILFTYL